MPSYSITLDDDMIDVCEEMMSYRQNVGVAKFDVPATPRLCGV